MNFAFVPQKMMGFCVGVLLVWGKQALAEEQMVWIPKGPSGGFWMDQTLVTAEAFAKWFSESKAALLPQLAKLQWSPPKTEEKDSNRTKEEDPNSAEDCTMNPDGTVKWFKTNHPVNCITWSQAERYCHARGARLPTLEEWKWAATGNTKHKYPWGNEEPGNKACWRDKGTCEVGTHVATWQGSVAQGAEKLYDMVGNVSQFTSTPPPTAKGKKWQGDKWGGVKYLTPHPCGQSERCIIVGSHWVNDLIDENPSVYSWYWNSSLGFRCVRNKK